MSTISLKSDLHKIIDEIKSEQLLETIYDFLKSRDTQNSNRIWGSLSEEEKREVLIAYDESEVECNLVSREEVFPSK